MEIFYLNYFLCRIGSMLVCLSSTEEILEILHHSELLAFFKKNLNCVVVTSLYPDVMKCTCLSGHKCERFKCVVDVLCSRLFS